MKTAQALFRDALELPEEQRAELVCNLLDTFTPPQVGPEYGSEAWTAEIRRRAQAALDGEPGIPWEEVRAELDKRLARG